MVINFKNIRIGIVGLGYVGLPLAMEFSKAFQVIGYDTNSSRVSDLNNGKDITDEGGFGSAQDFLITDKLERLRECNVYIVTVPTPIDKYKQPNLNPLISASREIGQILSMGNVVIFESTVYPGATEEDCIPVLEKHSNLKFNRTFFVGYSPERVNPGDKTRRLPDIVKVTSGSTPDVAEFISKLYSVIIKAGVHQAPSIKVAEAAKVIENVQRDVNIALMNEIHQIFDKMAIDTQAVISAASTKWNFMSLSPGLVGGHCISVDPYYLLHKSRSKGYIPDLIRTAREINDSMSSFYLNDFIKSLIKQEISLVDLSVAILGIAFKEDCPDIRNSKVVDLCSGLTDLGINIEIYDDMVCSKDLLNQYNLELTENFKNITSNVAILAVPHQSILEKIKSSNFEFVYKIKGE